MRIWVDMGGQLILCTIILTLSQFQFAIGSETNFDCLQRSDGIYENPSNCATFYVCSNGNQYLFNCTSPLLFNPKMFICDWPDNVNSTKCNDRFELEQTSSGNPSFQANSSDESFSCLAKLNGVYPNPRNCETFYKCSNGKSYLYKCPADLVFNPKFLLCDWKENVPGCFGITESPTTTKAPEVPLPTEAPIPDPSDIPEKPEPTEGPKDPEPTEAPEDPTPTESPNDPEPTEAPEDPTPTESPKDPEPTEGPKDPEPTEGPKDPEPTEGPKDPELTEAPKDPKPTEAPKDPEPTEAPKDPEPTESPKDPEPTEAPEDPTPTESPKDPEPTEGPKDPEPTEAPEDPMPTVSPEDPEPTEGPKDPEPTEGPKDPEPTKSPKDPEPFSCAEKPDGVYADPCDCYKFYKCSNSIAYQYDCPENLVFNPLKLICDYIQNVPSCNNNPVPPSLFTTSSSML